MVGGEIGLEDEHAGVEVERRRRAELRRPLHLLRALLAVADFVLGRVTPCMLAKTVHHSIKMAVSEVKEMVDVFEHLYVSV